jgi:hypothetical protein
MTLSILLVACGSVPVSTTAPVITPSGTMPLNPAASSAAPESTMPAATTTPAAATAPAAGQTFTGYLVDQKCGVLGIDIQDGTDLTKNPEKHTLSCAMMPGCLASGFGLFIKQTDGTYKFFKFDANGSKMAIDQIINKTSQQDNFLVDVSGTMSNNILAVSSITLK